MRSSTPLLALLLRGPQRWRSDASRTSPWARPSAPGGLWSTASTSRRSPAAFDPQPFHLDEKAAQDTIFRGLAASGWHTAAMTMRLLVESELKPAGGIVGAGFDEFRWPRPVRPGDELHLKSEVVDVRPSTSRPNQGLIKVRTTTLNQDSDPVQILVANLVVLRPPELGAGPSQRTGTC